MGFNLAFKGLIKDIHNLSEGHVLLLEVTAAVLLCEERVNLQNFIEKVC